MSETRLTHGREEEADAMLRRTRFKPGVAVGLTAAFLITAFGVPLAQIVAESQPGWLPDTEQHQGALIAGESSERTRPRLSDIRNVWPAPERIRAAHTPADYWSLLPPPDKFKTFEEDTEKTSLLFERLRPQTQLWLIEKMGIGNEQVMIGRDGWLFYREGLDYLTGPGFLEPGAMRRRQLAGSGQTDPLRAIVPFAQQLAARGIRLIVMPVPDKFSIYPEQFWDGYRGDPKAPPMHNPSYPRFVAALKKQGILVYDPSALLRRMNRRSRELLFLPTDTHWTPQAVELTATALGGFIRRQVALPPRPPVNYFHITNEGPAPSDLLRLLGLSADQTLFQSPRAPARPVITPQGVFYRPRRDADVLVMGDSFSGVYSEGAAGLAAQLSFVLKRPVDAISLPNGGSYKARLQLIQQMNRGIDRLKDKRLVIYEFTVRDLTTGDWRLLDLPPLSGAAPPGSASPLAAPQAVPARPGRQNLPANQPPAAPPRVRRRRARPSRRNAPVQTPRRWRNRRQPQWHTRWRRR